MAKKLYELIRYNNICNLKTFKMLGKTRYKLILFDKICYCWDFRFYGNLLKKN